MQTAKNITTVFRLKNQTCSDKTREFRILSVVWRHPLQHWSFGSMFVQTDVIHRQKYSFPTLKAVVWTLQPCKHWRLSDIQKMAEVKEERSFYLKNN
jgi:hypothetical protein